VISRFLPKTGFTSTKSKVNILLKIDEQLTTMWICLFIYNKSKTMLINSPAQSGEGIIGMHFVSLSVCMSVCLSVTFRVHAIIYVCIDGLPSNMVQMLSSLRRCAVTLTRMHTSKVKVTQDQRTCISYFPILDQW